MQWEKWKITLQDRNNFQEEMLTEVCNHCGKDVSFGSGRFVNRVHDFNDILTRLDNKLKFPLGDFVCEECESKTTDDYGEK